MQIEAGKRYRARNGKVYGPLNFTGDIIYPWSINGSGCWTRTGTCWTDCDSDMDLIELVPDEPTADPINHPPHYTTGKIEVADFIADQRLSFALGNVVEYCCRCDHKGKPLEDLKKAAWYLAREIKRREGA